MQLDEYRDAYDRPPYARVPRLGRREPGQALGVGSGAERPGERRTARVALPVDGMPVADLLAQLEALPPFTIVKFTEETPNA